MHPCPNCQHIGIFNYWIIYDVYLCSNQKLYMSAVDNYCYDLDSATLRLVLDDSIQTFTPDSVWGMVIRKFADVRDIYDLKVSLIII